MLHLKALYKIYNLKPKKLFKTIRKTVKNPQKPFKNFLKP